MEQREEPGWSLPFGFWFLIVLLLAAGLRFSHLGQPLKGEEAARALGAWQLVQGQTPWFWDEPALMVGTGAVFFVLGDSDTTARLLPAVMGTALVGSLWLIRGLLGGWGTLGAGLFMALSPTLVYFSRSLSDEALAIAIAFFLLLFWLSFRRGNSGALLAGAVAFAILLQLGAAGVTMAMIFGALFAFDVAAGRRTLNAEGAEEGEKGLAQEQGGRAVAFFLGAFLLVGTGFFLYPGGFGLPSLLAWVRQFDPPLDGRPWYIPWLRLFSYEPGALFFGSIGALYFLRPSAIGGEHDPEKRYFRRFLVLWGVAGALFLAIRGDSPEVIAPLVIPLTLLAGSFLGEAFSRMDRPAWRRFGFQVGPSAVLLGVTALVTTQLLRAEGSPGVRLPLIATGLVLLVVFILWPIGRGYQRVWATATMLGLFPVLAFTLHTTWSLNYGSGFEWFGPAPPQGKVLGELEKMARVQGYMGRNYDVAVEAALWRPLGWYLRDLGKVSFFQRLEPGPTYLVARATPGEVKKFSGYSKLSFPYETSWRPGAPDPKGFWRWLIYREAYGDNPQETRIVLYLKS